MRYMGSKRSLAKEIVPLLQNIIDCEEIETYVEPMCGGANIIDKIKCENKLAYDKSDTLIALLQQAAEDFSLIKESTTREEWERAKDYKKKGLKPDELTLADIGAIEYFASFSNGGFPKGYADLYSGRSHYNEGYRNLQAQAKDLKDIKFESLPYWDLPKMKNCLIYCDPPYYGVSQYGYAREGRFDHHHFWQWVRENSKENIVLVSELSAPEDFYVVWEKEYKYTTGTDNNKKITEKIFKYGGNDD